MSQTTIYGNLHSRKTSFSRSLENLLVVAGAITLPLAVAVTWRYFYSLLGQQQSKTFPARCRYFVLCSVSWCNRDKLSDCKARWTNRRKVQVVTPAGSFDWTRPPLPVCFRRLALVLRLVLVSSFSQQQNTCGGVLDRFRQLIHIPPQSECCLWPPSRYPCKRYLL